MGMAVSRFFANSSSLLTCHSISVQSTFAVGAVLNATFGSIIELILYCSAITKGTLDQLVQSAVTGSLLTTMLLLPGVSMIFGGLKYKEQRFNATAAGVSSVLLIISVIGNSPLEGIDSHRSFYSNDILFGLGKLQHQLQPL